MSYEECRLHCTGHILNLVVKALLFGKDSDALEMDAVDFKTWRKVGALGKLHKLPQHLLIYLCIVTTLRKIPQCSTR